MDSGLTDIALRGLEAARLLVDRFVGAVDATPDPDGATGSQRDCVASSTGVDGLSQVWADLLRTTADAWTGVATGEGGPSPSELRVGVAGGTVLPLSTAPGEVGSVELWLHNPTTAAVDEVRIVAPPLRSTSGSEIPESAVHVDPAELASVPARSSRGITISVTVPDDAPMGRYRGVVLVDGLPDVWALLDVRVGDS